MMTRRAIFLSTAGVLAAYAAMRFGAPTDAAPAQTFEVQKSDEEWRRLLTPAQYDVLRREGTERAGTSPLNNEKRKGAFRCAGCGEPLFDSSTKFESGTGWPSFWEPLPGAVGTSADRSFFHDPHRGALRQMRRPSRSRLSRRTPADRPALLHERRGAHVRGEEVIGRSGSA